MKGPRYVIVGGDTPLGADLREVLLHGEPQAHVKLVGSEDTEASILTLAGDEAAVITGLRAEDVDGAAAIFLAGTPDSSLRATALASQLKKGPALVDLTRAAGLPGTWKLRAPFAEPRPAPVPRGARISIAHPVAIALAIIARRLAEHAKIRQVVATAYLPASEWGREGIDELHKQTLSLFAIHRLPQAIFDTQLAFNLLARYGEEAPASLESVSARILGDLDSLAGLAPKIPPPSVRLLQASCMHGIAISLWLEFARGSAAVDVEATFRSDGFDVRNDSVDAPSPVGMAAQDGIAIGAIGPDTSNKNARWIFAAADNYRLMAREAAAVVQMMGGTGVKH